MEIGKPEKIIEVEPVQDPFRKTEPAPAPAPAPTPAPERTPSPSPEREPAKVAV